MEQSIPSKEFDVSDQPSAEVLRQQMSAVRHQLDGEAVGITHNARQLADWRNYVRAFPWGSLAAATVLGYLAVPRRLEIVSPDVETLEKLAKKNRLVVDHQPKGSEKPSAVTSLANLVGNMVLRAGLAYAGQYAGKFFGEQAAPAEKESGVYR